MPFHSMLRPVDITDGFSSGMHVLSFTHPGILMDYPGVESQCSFLHTTSLSHHAILGGGLHVLLSPSYAGLTATSHQALHCSVSQALDQRSWIIWATQPWYAGNGMFGDSPSPGIVYSLQHGGSLATILDFVEVPNPLVK